MEYFLIDASVTFFVEEDVLVEQLGVQLGLGPRVHALRSNLDSLLQTIQNTFGIAELKEKAKIRGAFMNDVMQI